MPYIPLTFHTIISEIADQQGLIHRTYSGGWIHELSNNSTKKIIIGLRFPLNNESSAGVARDKTATSCILAAKNLPVVDHILISLPHKYVEGHFLSVMNAVEGQYGYPLVVKPNTGSEGKKVELVHNRTELLRYIDEMHTIGIAAVLSPFIESAVEYRVVILDQDVLLILKKNPQEGEWRHNLARGATASIDIDSTTKKHLGSLAQKVMTALDLRVASVDVLVDVKGVFRVLEVNSSVSLLHFAKQSREYYQQAKDVYALLVRESMNS